jgi:hypothetical protein
LPEIGTADKYSGSASTNPSTVTVNSFPNELEFTLPSVSVLSEEFSPVRALLL